MPKCNVCHHGGIKDCAGRQTVRHAVSLAKRAICSRSWYLNATNSDLYKRAPPIWLPWGRATWLEGEIAISGLRLMHVFALFVPCRDVMLLEVWRMWQFTRLRTKGLRNFNEPLYIPVYFLYLLLSSVKQFDIRNDLHVFNCKFVYVKVYIRCLLLLGLCVDGPRIFSCIKIAPTSEEYRVT